MTTVGRTKCFYKLTSSLSTYGPTTGLVQNHIELMNKSTRPNQPVHGICTGSFSPCLLLKNEVNSTMAITEEPYVAATYLAMAISVNSTTISSSTSRLG